MMRVGIGPVKYAGVMMEHCNCNCNYNYNYNYHNKIIISHWVNVDRYSLIEHSEYSDRAIQSKKFWSIVNYKIFSSLEHIDLMWVGYTL